MLAVLKNGRLSVKRLPGRGKMMNPIKVRRGLKARPTAKHIDRKKAARRGYRKHRRNDIG